MVSHSHETKKTFFESRRTFLKGSAYGVAGADWLRVSLQP